MHVFLTRKLFKFKVNDIPKARANFSYNLQFDKKSIFISGGHDEKIDFSDSFCFDLGISLQNFSINNQFIVFFQFKSNNIKIFSNISFFFQRKNRFSLFLKI